MTDGSPPEGMLLSDKKIGKEMKALAVLKYIPANVPREIFHSMQEKGEAVHGTGMELLQSVFSVTD